MAVEYVNTQAAFSIAASADLSTKQFTFVKFGLAGALVAVAAATDVPVGVLLNNPTSGKTAEVAVSGIVKLKAGATITAGALIGTTAAGLATPLTAGTDTTKYVLGQAITGGSSNDIITVAVNCVNLNRAA